MAAALPAASAAQNTASILLLPSSWLALRAPVGQSRIQTLLADADRRAAPAAGQPRATVYPQSLVWARPSCRLPETRVGGHRRERFRNVRAQYPLSSIDDRGEFVVADIAHERERVDPTDEQHFGLVDIPQARDQPLVEQRVGNRHRAAFTNPSHD